MDEQWVNLPKNSKMAEGGPTHRLGDLRVRVKFQKATLGSYKWRIRQTDGVRYSKAERKRNRRFRLFLGGSRTNDSKTELRVMQEFHLPAAGGNKYEAVAIRNKKEVKSQQVEVRRRIWYQIMHMKSISSLSLSHMENAFWNPGKNLYLQVKKVGADAPIDYIKTLWKNKVKKTSNYTQFINAAKTAWSARDKVPYAFAVAFVDYIAKSGETTIKQPLNFNVPSKLSSWSWRGDEQTINIGSKYLWFGLDDQDDKNRSWFIAATLIFIGSDGTKKALGVAPGDAAIAGPDYAPYGGKKQVKLRITEASLKKIGMSRNFFTSKKGSWTLKLTVRTLAGHSGGFAFTEIPLLAISTRSWFKDRDKNDMLATVVHEVGHKVGLAARGDGTKGGPLPDKNSHLYGWPKGVDDRGHNGPHCANGATWNGTNWSGTPICVMFGSNGYVDKSTKKWVQRKADFCPDCEKIVRKLDLAGVTLVTTGFKKPL